MKSEKIKYLLGTHAPKVFPLEPFSDVVCEFMDEISKVLRKNAAAKSYSDIISLAFWCRKANIMKIKKEYEDGKYRLGRGLVFHITPSNVPINFAFSYFFGLLSGNANIVRVPSKNFIQGQIICDAIKNTLENINYEIIKNTTLFISYEKDKEITDYYSLICDGRVIWGGDEAIKDIRQSPLKEKAVEIVFADRYSFAVFNSDALMKASNKEIQDIANKFYNDTYLMDQNACSTPHLILWIGKNKLNAKEKFWKNVFKVAGKYELDPIKVVDKYTQVCELAIERHDIIEISKFENLLYIIDIKELPENLSSLRGKFGLFFQCDIDSMEQIVSKVTDKVQTLIYYGIDKQELVNFVMKNHLKGVDRVVSIGEALNIGVYWDGYDIIRMLSRQISI